MVPVDMINSPFYSPIRWSLVNDVARERGYSRRLTTEENPLRSLLVNCQHMRILLLRHVRPHNANRAA
jgi:hypothetical protein